jgi:NADP-dependent 3-hydroxy acid dehydrogenase YdfG
VEELVSYPFLRRALEGIVSYMLLGIGLMMAKALEHSGAIVYIVGRRLEVLEKAAKEHSVSLFYYKPQPMAFLKTDILSNSSTAKSFLSKEM